MKNSGLLFFLVSCRLKSVSHSPLSGWAGFPNIFWRYFANEPNGKALQAEREWHYRPDRDRGRPVHLYDHGLYRGPQPQPAYGVWRKRRPDTVECGVYGHSAVGGYRYAGDGLCGQQAFCHGPRHGSQQLLCSGGGQHCRYDRNGVYRRLQCRPVHHSGGRHFVPGAVLPTGAGKDRGGHSSGCAYGHCPGHRPDADEHRFRFQCRCAH